LLSVFAQQNLIWTPA